MFDEIAFPAGTNLDSPEIVQIGSGPTTHLRRFKIVHVCRQYRPAIGGMEGVVEALALRQRAEGHDVSVVTLNRVFADPTTRLSAREDISGIHVIRIPFVGSRRYPIAPGVLRHIQGASVVHVHGVDFFYDFLALTHALHRRSLVATTHGGFFHTPYAGALKRLWFAGPTRISSHRYKAVVACSEQDADQFDRITPANLVTVENGVELEQFAGVASRDRDGMLYFGRLSTNKGLDDLLAWFAVLHRAAPQWTLTIAGRMDGMTLADLADQVAIHGLVGAVRIVDSPSAARLLKVIGEASVYVSASRYEGFGIAPIEAAAAGLFPVLRDIPPFARTVERLEIGVLSDFAPEPKSVQAVLAAIADWRGQRSVMPRLDGFGWRTAAERYGRIYRHCSAKTRRIGKVDVALTDKASVIETIDRHVADRAALTIAFCNAHTVNVAEGDDALADALKSALVLNDGVGVDMASRLLFGSAFPENLNGTDLTPAILHESRHNLRIFVVGAAPGIADRAAATIRESEPRHSIVGTHHGFFGPDEETALTDRIVRAKPDLVLVGMGHPQQELWAARHAPRFSCVTICVGALIDRFAGEVKRAPAWVRSARAEWVYRLLREPRRLARRYLVGNITFVSRVMRQRGNGAPRLS